MIFSSLNQHQHQSPRPLLMHPPESADAQPPVPPQATANLRDHLASLAMLGSINHFPATLVWSRYQPEIAAEAYAMADAMLLERSRGA